ncbi:MAG: phage tail protein [Oscillospiraceae bacterium]|nr:phage tail protein [Oscillospiraceae bacterium]
MKAASGLQGLMLRIWDGIARRTMGSEMFKDALMKNNVIHRNIYIFSAGVTLYIPAVSNTPPPTLPPWKR